MHEPNNCSGRRIDCEKSVATALCAVSNAQLRITRTPRRAWLQHLRVFCGLSLISWFETPSLPALRRRYPRGFTLYLGNPFPRIMATCLPNVRHQPFRTPHDIGV